MYESLPEISSRQMCLIFWIVDWRVLLFSVLLDTICWVNETKDRFLPCERSIVIWVPSPRLHWNRIRYLYNLQRNQQDNLENASSGEGRVLVSEPLPINPQLQCLYKQEVPKSVKKWLDILEQHEGFLVSISSDHPLWFFLLLWNIQGNLYETN